MDLRKPQDYFHRVWATAFRAADLAHTQQEQGEQEQGEQEQAEHADEHTPADEETCA